MPGKLSHSLAVPTRITNRYLFTMIPSSGATFITGDHYVQIVATLAATFMVPTIALKHHPGLRSFRIHAIP